jgi:3-phosphoshikimate 1-carboxyvinyltransferase
VVVKDPLISEDTKATIGAIKAFGSKVENRADGSIVVHGDLKKPEVTIDAMNSGTTLRLMAGIAGLVEGTTTLTGDESLRKRPMAPLLSALEQIGARTRSDNGLPPLEVRGIMDGGKASIRGDVSSQFISSLMIAGSQTENGVEVEIEGNIVSRPYLDITTSVLEQFGIECKAKRSSVRVPGRQRAVAKEYTVPGDFSSAAFMLCAGAIAPHGSRVTVTNLKDRVQADAVILGILRSSGSEVISKGSGIEVYRDKELTGIDIDLNDCPDLFPVLCIVAAKAHGTSVLRGAGHLRFKESDRIDAMHRLLSDIGVPSEQLEDGLEIKGSGWIRGGTIRHFGDHRIAMAGAIAGIASEDGVVIPGAEVCGVSYPGFVEDLKKLGARVEVER